MTWKYHSGGNWTQATIKRREDDQWIAIGGGDDVGGGDDGDDTSTRWYTDEPSRGAGNGSTGADIIVPDDYSSIQTAHDNAAAGDRIWIDPSQGPYTESIQYSQDSITFDGYDPDTGSKAVIQAPDSTSHVFYSANPSWPYDTSLEQSLDGNSGETVIAVTDASAFSVGDVVHITEERDTYTSPVGDKEDVEFDYTTELRIVESVDTSSSPNTITVDHEILLPFPNVTTTGVGVWTPTVDDVRLHGMDIQGEGKGTSGLTVARPSGNRRLWVDNCRFAETGDGYLLGINESFDFRIDDCDFENSDRYGASIYRGSNRGYITNVRSDNINRYTTRFGANSDRSAADFKVDNVYGVNHAGWFTCKAHYGAFFIDWSTVEADAHAAGARLTSPEATIDGVIAQSDGTDSMDVFRVAWYTENVTVKNTTAPIDGYGSGEVFAFFLDRTDRTEIAKNITFENIEINEFGGNTITDIGEFRFLSDDTVQIDGLTFRNVTYGDQDLTRSDVESWSGYDASKINNLTVE